MTLGGRILKARKMARQSREKLSRSIDMSSRTIERWENGDTEPNAGDLAILARVLEVSEHWLRTGEGDMFSAADTGLAPAGGDIDQNPTPAHQTIISNRGGDMYYNPSWAMPMILDAQKVILNASDLERARVMQEAGKPFLVRIVVVEEDKPPEPPRR